MSDNNHARFDIKKRQQNAFLAAVENAKSANDAISKAQSWFLGLGLAELSFLGAVLLGDFLLTCPFLFFVKSVIILLLLSFVVFVVASVLQYQYLLKIARHYEKISNRANDYLKKGIRELDQEPDDIKFEDEQIKSNPLTNYLFITSLFLVLVSTVGIIGLVIFV